MRTSRTATWLAVSAACLFTVTALPASAAESPGAAAAGFMQLLGGLLLVLALGFAHGAFGHTVNNLFRRRSELTYQVMRRSPKLSLLTGSVITLVTLGVIAIFHGAPPLQMLILLVYLGLLGMFALGASARLAASHIDRQHLLEDELPDARAHVKGSMLLAAINGVPLLGSLLYFGILLAAVGAALLSLFAGKPKAPAPPQAAAAQPPPAGPPPAGPPPAGPPAGG